MSSLDLIRMGLKNLWRRKLRTFLTILGVIIGTSSIVIMVSLGFGMSESFKNEISKMGSLNTINVHPSYNMDWQGGMSSNSLGNSIQLDDNAVAQFRSIDGVKAVSPIVETYLKFVSGKYSAHISIKGIEASAMEAFDFKVADGRLLQAGDTFHLVFGSNVSTMFYDERAMSRNYYHPVQEATVDLLKDRLVMTFDMSYGSRNKDPNAKLYTTYKVKGVGILEAGDYEKDYYAFMPIDQLKKLIEEKEKIEAKINKTRPPSSKDKKGYDRVMVNVEDMKNVQKIQQQIKDMGFEAYSLSDYLESMQNTAASIQAILGGIGAVSLLVAALGITNTMIMSIYERTREIGIMKVIGASLSDIRKIFLFEASMIGLSGGVFGIGLSYLASFALNSIGSQFINFLGPGGSGNKISIIPLWLALASISFTTIVGLVSGFYPARRAMKLSALEAIKTE